MVSVTIYIYTIHYHTLPYITIHGSVMGNRLCISILSPPKALVELESRCLWIPWIPVDPIQATQVQAEREEEERTAAERAQ